MRAVKTSPYLADRGMSVRDYSRSLKVEIKTTSVYQIARASAEQVEMVVDSIARIIYTTSYRRLHDAAFDSVLQWYDPVRRV